MSFSAMTIVLLLWRPLHGPFRDIHTSNCQITKILWTFTYFCGKSILRAPD